MRFERKDLLGLENLTADEINLILETAVSMKELFTRSVKKVPTLRGKTVVILFYEPSTRTRVSFELAAKRLSADTVNISSSSSSVAKGESIIDTVKTIEALGADFIVIRHPSSGAPHLISNRISSSIINAGDGMHEHPTQALLDLFSIKEKKGRIAGLKVGIVGDISHSRVARSNIWGLKKLGAEVFLIGPPTLIPRDAETLGVKVYYRLEKIIKKLDVINILRIQRERQKDQLLPSMEEYNSIFGVSLSRLEKARNDLVIMHPGPMNRGIEVTSPVADSKNAIINEQVKNGVAVRMAVLYLLAGGKNENIA
ncbi:MAG: aspartate carbamoyltransferase catalytic subunit [Elusimicrobia bacterium]|nr:aspartate carbamoyltransferase catalytic subunit [Elusimicrobiota bacterium]